MHSSSVSPLSSCCLAWSVMVICAPLMPLWVVLLLLPLAAIAIGGLALKLPLVGKVLPGTWPPVAA